MAPRVLALMFVALCTATIELRPFPLPSETVVVTNANRTPPPQLVSMTVSKTALTTSETQFSVALTVSNCPSCSVYVTLYASSGINTLPPNGAQGGVRASRSMQYGPAGVFNTSEPSGGSGDAPWNPFSGGGYPNGQYFWLVQVQSSNGLQGTYVASDLQAFGIGAVTLSGSTPPAAPWTTVDYLDISPHSVSSLSAVLSINLHVTLSAAEPYVEVYISRNSVWYIDYLYVQGNTNGGWLNFSFPINAGWSSYSTPGNLQAGVRYANVIVYSDNAFPTLTFDHNRLTALGFNPTLTLSGAFSTDVTPPTCNYTINAAIPTDAHIRILTPECTVPNDVYEAAMIVVAPTVTPPQRLPSGFDTSVSDMGEGVFLYEGYAGGNYRVTSFWVSDPSGNVAVYSNHVPPLTVGALLSAFGEGDETTAQIATAYLNGEFTTTSSASVLSAWMVLLASLAVMGTLL